MAVVAMCVCVCVCGSYETVAEAEVREAGRLHNLCQEVGVASARQRARAPGSCPRLPAHALGSQLMPSAHAFVSCPRLMPSAHALIPRHVPSQAAVPLRILGE
jgi:hypothetical protein